MYGIVWLFFALLGAIAHAEASVLCKHKGTEFRPGQETKIDCQQCYCLQSGQWVCKGEQCRKGLQLFPGHYTRVRKGSSIYLVCKNDQRNTKFLWFVNGRLFNFPQRVSMDKSSTSSVIRLDSKKFMSPFISVVCHVSTLKMKRIKVFFVKDDVLPSGFPRIHATHRTVEVSRGLDVSLPCSVTGRPSPNVTWFKFGLPLNVNKNSFIVTSESGLMISRAVPSDAGLYECMVTNDLGSVLSNSTTELVVNKDAMFRATGKLSFSNPPSDIPKNSCLHVFLTEEYSNKKYASIAVTKLQPSASKSSSYEFIAHFDRRPPPGSYRVDAIQNFGTCLPSGTNAGFTRDGDAVTKNSYRNVNFYISEELTELPDIELDMFIATSYFIDAVFRVMGQVSFPNPPSDIPKNSCLHVFLTETYSNQKYASIAVSKLQPFASKASSYEFIAHFDRRPPPGHYYVDAIQNFGTCLPNGTNAGVIRDGDALTLIRDINLVNRIWKDTPVSSFVNLEMFIKISYLKDVTFRGVISTSGYFKDGSKIPNGSCMKIGVVSDSSCSREQSCTNSSITTIKMDGCKFGDNVKYTMRLKAIEPGSYSSAALLQIGHCDQSLTAFQLMHGKCKPTNREKSVISYASAEVENNLEMSFAEKMQTISGNISFRPAVKELPLNSCLFISISRDLKCHGFEDCGLIKVSKITNFRLVDSVVKYEIVLGILLDSGNYLIDAFLNVGWCSERKSGSNHLKIGDYESIERNSIFVLDENPDLKLNLVVDLYKGPVIGKDVSISGLVSLVPEISSSIPKSSCLIIQVQELLKCQRDSSCRAPYYAVKRFVNPAININAKVYYNFTLNNLIGRNFSVSAVLNVGWCKDFVKGAKQVRNGDYYTVGLKAFTVTSNQNEVTKDFELHQFGASEGMKHFAFSFSSKDGLFINIPSSSCVDVQVTDTSFIDDNRLVISKFFRYENSTKLNQLTLSVPNITAETFELTISLSVHIGHCMKSVVNGDLVGQKVLIVEESTANFVASLFVKEHVLPSATLCTYFSCHYHGTCTVVGNSTKCNCPYCPEINIPICASDGKTYNSECDMKKTSCYSKKYLYVLFKGKCENVTIIKGQMRPSGHKFSSPCFVVKIDNATAYNGDLTNISIPRSSAGKLFQQSVGSEYAISIQNQNSSSSLVDATYDTKLFANFGSCPQGFIHIPENRSSHGSLLQFNFWGESVMEVYDFEKGCGNCTFNSVCRYRDEIEDFVCACPTGCEEDENPVCGSDGVTYSNECQMKSRNCFLRKSVEVIYPGKCEPSACKKTKCPYGKCKVLHSGNEVCICTECSSVKADWVCGSNGKNYFNDCERKRDACLRKTNIEFVRTGRCELDSSLMTGTIFPRFLQEEIIDDDVNCLIIKKFKEESISEVSGITNSSLNNVFKTLFSTFDYSFNMERNVFSISDLLSNSNISFSIIRSLENKISSAFKKIKEGKNIVQELLSLMPMLTKAADVVKDGSMVSFGNCSDLEQNKHLYRKTKFSFPGSSDMFAIFYEKKCTETCTDYSRCHTFENGTSRCICQLGCGRNLDPVCASNGKSYDNLCIMERESCLKKAGLTVKHEGECDPCEKKSCKFNSKCKIDENGDALCVCKPFCPLTYKPVCGSDNEDYANECLMTYASCNKQVKITVKKNGKCNELSTENKCTEKCTDYSRCHTFENGTSRCICQLGCGRNLDPVCASDGKSYDNLCIMERESCLKKAGLTVKHEGECDNTIEVSGIISATGLASNISSKSCLIIEVADISLQDVKSISLGLQIFQIGSNLQSFPYKYTIKSLKPNNDAVEVTVSATLHVNHCSKSIKSGDFITDTNFALDLTDREKSSYNVDVSLVKYVYDVCSSVVCKNHAVCRKKEGKAVCECLSFCQMDYKPVCGSDGTTYANECIMKSISCFDNKTITITHDGICKKTCAEKCTDYSRCHTFENGTSSCICQLGCGRNLDPVCASDGKSYDNLCIMERESCLRKAGLTVKHEGECDNTIEVSGIISATGLASNISSKSCLIIEVADISLQDVKSISLGLQIIRIGSNSQSFPYKYTIKSLKPNNDAVEVTVSATLHVNHCSKSIKSGDFITDTNFALNLTDREKSSYNVDVSLVKYVYDVCSPVVCNNHAVCRKKEGKAVCECLSFCQMDYKPVCGSDGGTYANECIMKSISCFDNKTITITHDGICKKKCTEKCTDYSRCHTFENGTSRCICQLGCGRNLDPVCASDGKSYDNLCIMERESCLRKAGLTVKHEGECEKKCTEKCTDYSRCHTFENGTSRCICQLGCGRNLDPVCASDGKSYDNLCIMERESCLRKAGLTVKHEGECEKKCTEKCTDYSRCHTFENGTSRCICQLGCGRNLHPVCASDGKSYDNLCIMERESCLRKAGLTVKHEGECDQKCKTELDEVVPHGHILRFNGIGCPDCQCKNGQIKCPAISCPDPDIACPDGVLQMDEGDCCPTCVKQNRCTVSGKSYSIGEIYFVDKSSTSCNLCTCLAGGRTSCKQQNCPPLLCKKPINIDSSCCPVCPTEIRCKHPKTGELYKLGETWSNGEMNACSKCACVGLSPTKGSIECREPSCPVLNCQKLVYLKGSCCPTCYQRNPVGPVKNIYNRFHKAYLNPKITYQASCVDPNTNLVYAEGETWKQGCLTYKCISSGIIATRQKCPILTCPINQQINRQGACCSECHPKSMPELLCSGKDLMLVVPKTFLPYAKTSELIFDNSECSATFNGTHFVLRTDFQSCGTTKKSVNGAFEYRNLARTVAKPGAFISRVRPIQIPVVCVIPKRGGMMTFSKAFKSRKDKPALSAEVKSSVNLKPEIEVIMEVTTKLNGKLPAGAPVVVVGVGENVFVDIKKVEKQPSRWAVTAKQCYLTPDSDPKNPTKHILIENGCPIDPTVTFYPVKDNNHRFSFKSVLFQASKDVGFFLHCDVETCDSSARNSLCPVPCDKNHRKRIPTRRKRNSFRKIKFTSFISYSNN